MWWASQAATRELVTRDIPLCVVGSEAADRLWKGLEMSAGRSQWTAAGPAALVGIALLLSGCGTTVPLSGSASSAQDSSLGTGGELPGGQTPADGAAGTSVGSGADVTAPGHARRAPGASGSTSLSPPAGSAVSSSSLVPAVFKIGMQYSGNANAAMSSIGGSTFKDDRRPENDAVIAWINKHGGIGGRPASPVYNDIDATANPSAESEAACTQWTQDAHVSFAIPRSAVADNDLLRTCLKKAGVPSMVEQTSRTTEADLRSSPLWFEPEALSLNAYARTYVEGLARQGFFASGKVGVVYYGVRPPDFRSISLESLTSSERAGVSS